MDAKATVDFSEGLILVSGPVNALRYISRIPGAKIRRDNVWRLPLTLDSYEELRMQRVPLSPELEEYAGRLKRIQRYIEHVKVQDGPVEPLQPIPIKAPYSLYNHQIKAYNIALALFGRGARKGAQTGSTRGGDAV